MDGTQPLMEKLLIITRYMYIYLNIICCELQIIVTELTLNLKMIVTLMLISGDLKMMS